MGSVLGIDPGTALCGFGVVREDAAGLHMVACGAIVTAPADTLSVRLLRIYEALEDLIRTHQPSEVAVEELFFNRNVRTALQVGQARGVVLLAAAAHGLPVAEYTPPEVKQAVVGYGRAEKGQVQEMVRLQLAMDDLPRPDDAADALAVAICHVYARRLAARLAGGRETV